MDIGKRGKAIIVEPAEDPFRRRTDREVVAGEEPRPVGAEVRERADLVTR